MKIFPKRKVAIAKNLNVWVTNHYTPNLFGIRGKYEASYKSGHYIERATPGTGFFVRNSSSKSYKEFCKGERAKLVPSYWKMVKGQEFDFENEIARAEAAQAACREKYKEQILESYARVLPYAKQAEECERFRMAIKDLGHKRHKLTSYQSHVLANIKSKIAKLEHDVRNLQIIVPTTYGEEKYEAFSKVVIAFSELTGCHRIWHSRTLTEDMSLEESGFRQVYFDMGIFNYMQAPLMTPMMRDSYGNLLLWYPDFVVFARDAVDFDVIPIEELTMRYDQSAYDMIADQVLESYSNEVDGLSQRQHSRSYEEYGDGLLVNKDSVSTGEDDGKEHHHQRMVSDIYFKQLKLRFYFSENRKALNFHRVFDEYQEYYKQHFLEK